MLGNDAVSSFDYLTGYNITSSFYLFGNSPYPIISSAGLANPNVTWESMKLGNVGIEGILWAAKLPPDGPTGGFFKDRKPLDW